MTNEITIGFNEDDGYVYGYLVNSSLNCGDLVIDTGEFEIRASNGDIFIKDSEILNNGAFEPLTLTKSSMKNYVGCKVRILSERICPWSVIKAPKLEEEPQPARISFIESMFCRSKKIRIYNGKLQ